MLLMISDIQTPATYQIWLKVTQVLIIWKRVIQIFTQLKIFQFYVTKHFFKLWYNKFSSLFLTLASTMDTLYAILVLSAPLKDNTQSLMCDAIECSATFPPKRANADSKLPNKYLLKFFWVHLIKGLWGHYSRSISILEETTVTNR